MWQKLKLEKLNIITKVISKFNVATMIETHSKVIITFIEVDKQMAIIQIQVGKNIVEDVLLDGRASVNIIIENLITKIGLPKLRPTRTTQNDISKYDQTFRNHNKFEDSHTWHTLCSHIYCFAKQCGRFLLFYVIKKTLPQRRKGYT